MEHIKDIEQLDEEATRELVEAYLQSGMSLPQFCRSKRIKPAAFRQITKRLNATPERKIKRPEDINEDDPEDTEIQETEREYGAPVRIRANPSHRFVNKLHPWAKINESKMLRMAKGKYYDCPWTPEIEQGEKIGMLIVEDLR